MASPQDLWIRQGETLSHKNACKEFGLEESEILEAMRAGKLQFKEQYAHGNPYFRLLHKEVIALALELRGDISFKKQQIEHKIQEVTKEINNCKRKVKAFEKERELLIKKLDQLPNNQYENPN
jgi:hypothetical protein